MFSGSIFSSNDSSMDSYFNNSQIFIPNVDHKLKIYLEKKCNKYIKIPFSKDFENEEFTFSMNQKKILQIY